MLVCAYATTRSAGLSRGRTGPRRSASARGPRATWKMSGTQRNTGAARGHALLCRIPLRRCAMCARHLRASITVAARPGRRTPPPLPYPLSQHGPGSGSRGKSAETRGRRASPQNGDGRPPPESLWQSHSTSSITRRSRARSPLQRGPAAGTRHLDFCILTVAVPL